MLQVNQAPSKSPHATQSVDGIAEILKYAQQRAAVALWQKVLYTEIWDFEISVPFDAWQKVLYPIKILWPHLPSFKRCFYM